MVAPGALLTLVGLVLLGPAVARPASALLGTPSTLLRGTTGSLARRNAMRNPRSTAGAATALMVGVAVVTVFTVLAASIKASIGEVVRTDFHGDLVIVNNDPSGSGVDPALVGRLEALPDVREATGFGIARSRASPAAARRSRRPMPRRLGSVIDLHVQHGAFAAVGPAGVAVSQRFADDHGLALGGTVPVQFGNGAGADLPHRCDLRPGLDLR